jgi:hypothetical protein
VKMRLNIFYTTSMNKEQTLLGIVIAISSRRLKLRTLLQKLYSQINKLLSFIEMCSPQFARIGAIDRTRA